MKKFIYSLPFLLFFASISFSQDLNYDYESGVWNAEYNRNPQGYNSNSVVFTWQQVTAPLNTQILDIIFVDSLHGWLSHNSNGAMRTTDGGFNWSLISFNDTNFSGSYNAVHFVDQNTGWCTGSAIQIRKTTNGGLNWFKQYGPPVAGIAHSIYFFDANTGIIIGSKNFPYVPFVARSTNGGTNWTEIGASFAGAQELNEQYWLNSTTGWIAGYDVLLKTTDGGSTFTNYMSNVPPTGNGHNALLCIYFANQLTGWIGGSNLEKKNIYKTTNGGTSWVFQPNPVSTNNTYAQINDILFISQDSGWAIHGTPFSGAIMFTTDGGQNWITEEGSNNWFDCIASYQRKKAWCGASNGNIWYTILTPPLGVSSNNNEVPKQFELYQNYPNPFNPVTKIKFDLPAGNSGKGLQPLVQIKVFDVLGDEVAVLVDKDLKPGSYSVEWNAENMPSGVYFYRLVVSDALGTNNTSNGGAGLSYSSTNKMILLK